jgi:hypothetical protein
MAHSPKSFVRTGREPSPAQVRWVEGQQGVSELIVIPHQVLGPGAPGGPYQDGGLSYPAKSFHPHHLPADNRSESIG